MFNLPTDITAEDIQVTLQVPKTKAKLHYDLLGLPAFAQLQFNTPEELEECLSRVPKRQVRFGERVARLRSYEDRDKMKLGYRRVVVEIPENASVEETVIELGKFGRLMHIDWPLEASISPSVEQAKEHYKGTS